jgi:hypothetical protein
MVVVWCPPPVGTVVEVEWKPPYGACRGRVVTTDKSTTYAGKEGEAGGGGEEGTRSHWQQRTREAVVGVTVSKIAFHLTSLFFSPLSPCLSSYINVVAHDGHTKHYTVVYTAV